MKLSLVPGNSSIVLSGTDIELGPGFKGQYPYFRISGAAFRQKQRFNYH